MRKLETSRLLLGSRALVPYNVYGSSYGLSKVAECLQESNGRFIIQLNARVNFESALFHARWTSTFLRCSVTHLHLFTSLFNPLLQSRAARGAIVHKRQANFGQVQVVPTIAEGAFADVSFRSSDRACYRSDFLSSCNLLTEVNPVLARSRNRGRRWCREPPWSRSESRKPWLSGLGESKV